MHHGSNENNSQHEEIHRRDCISSSQLVYIASPYAGDIQSNTQFAIQCCRYAIQQGCTPVGPYLLYPQMLDDSDPEQRAIGLKLGHRLLSVCQEVSGLRWEDQQRNGWRNRFGGEPWHPSSVRRSPRRIPEQPYIRR